MTTANATWEKILHQWARLRMAHEAMMLQDAQGVLTMTREQNQAHHERMCGPSPKSKEEDVIHIGDQVIHAAQQPQARSLLPWALLAAGLVGGLGLGGVAVGLALRPGASAPPQTREFRVDIWMEDGKAKSQVVPVPPSSTR